MKTITRKDAYTLRSKHFSPSCGLFFEEDPLKIVRGRKHFLYDESGNKYLDCINNVAHVGHCHDYVTQAGCRQMEQLYTNSRYLHDGLSTYVARLASLFPKNLDVIFLVNSGSEANDMALQLAHNFTGGDQVLSLEHAYHGTVISTVGISQHKWKVDDKMRSKNLHLCSVPDVYRGKHSSKEDPCQEYANEIKATLEAIKKEGKKTSAFIMESMISCGGQVVPPDGYMKKVFEYVKSYGGVCIADEVQVGFGRVGTHMWSFEQQGAEPDIVTVGKPIGNGHPMSAIITTREIADSFLKGRGSYFNTFGGNPVSCAIGHAVLDVLENENMMKNAQSVGTYAIDQLNILKQRHEIIGDVRGVGLFIGIEFVKDKKTKTPASAECTELQKLLKKRFVIISVEGPYYNVLKFKPPMTFGKEDVDYLIKALEESIKEVEAMVPEKLVNDLEKIRLT